MNVCDKLKAKMKTSILPNIVLDLRGRGEVSISSPKVKICAPLTLGHTNRVFN